MAAAWRDELSSASFRGVSFFVRTAEGDHGRRLATQEYPLRDEPWNRDLGRKAKTFSLDAYVLEPDHIGQAKKLIEAVEKPGSATLVHPWLGDIAVNVTGCHVRFSHDEGGMASFSMSFIEAGKQIYPAALKKNASIVERAASTAKSAITSRLLQDFTLDGVASWVADAAEDVFGGSMTEISETLTPALGQAGAWAKDIQSAISTATTIVRDPAALATRVLGAMDIGNLSGISSIVQTSLSALSALDTYTRPGAFDITWQMFLPLSSFGLSSSSGASNTSMARRAATNAAAINAFVRRSATIEMARTATRQDYDASSDATAAADAVSSAVDRELASAGDDDGQALHALSIATQRAIALRLPDLPSVVKVTGASDIQSLSRDVGYTPSSTLPALVIAYAVYGDKIDDVISRSDQIVKRNNIAHPAFVPGGEPLELLSSD